MVTLVVERTQQRKRWDQTVAKLTNRDTLTGELLGKGLEMVACRWSETLLLGHGWRSGDLLGCIRKLLGGGLEVEIGERCDGSSLVVYLGQAKWSGDGVGLRISKAECDDDDARERRDEEVSFLLG